jgi:hypothetical protein
MEEKLLPGRKDLKKTEYGVWTVVGRTVEKGKQKKLEDVPPLDKVKNRSCSCSSYLHSFLFI